MPSSPPLNGVYAIAGTPGTDEGLLVNVVDQLRTRIGHALPEPSVSRVNDEVLAALGASATEPPPITTDWSDDVRLSEVRQTATALIRELHSTGELVALIDPRMAMLLPFWQTVTPIAGCVVVVRDPPRGGDVRWLRHILPALQTDRCLVIEESSVLVEPALVAERVAALVDRTSLEAELAATQTRAVELETRLRQAESERDTLRQQAEGARRAATRANDQLRVLRRSYWVRGAMRLRSLAPTRARHVARRAVRRLRQHRPARRAEHHSTPASDRQIWAPPQSPRPTAGEVGHLERVASRPPVTVIVPVYNAYEDVRRCLASVRRNTTAHDCSVLVIDDASTDTRIATLLDEIKSWDNVEVLRNPSNLGFTRTVNRGLQACTGDVVLLNSDCEVTPRWMQNLVDAAYSNEHIATVTATSDNAGAFSVPRIGVPNDRPVHLTKDEIGRLITRTSERVRPTAPTGNGFCMYIKRAALDEVGLLDEERFPRGYGEEGDFCMRALRAGWSNVVDDATIVFHRRSASFGPEKAQLIDEGRRQLDTRYPEYTQLVREFVASESLGNVHRRVAESYELATALSARVRPRILFVHHRGTGGTIETNADLMLALLDRYEPFLLTSDTRGLELSRFDAEGAALLERSEFDEPLTAEAFTNPQYRAIVADVMRRAAIDLLHVRVLLAHTFDLPSVARALDVPVVLSFHDFFLVCPTVHLLDENDQFCGGVCTPGAGNCRIPSPWVAGVPRLKHGWVRVWQQHVAEMLPNVDAFVTTSPSARDIYLRSYPELRGAPFHVIEHGRDLPAETIGAPPEPGEPVRIAVPGSLDVHKGARLIEELLRLDVDGRLEFHFFGRVPEQFRHLGVMHGSYQRDELNEKLRAVRPSFLAVLSIWAETYSHTLSEAWAAGIPALVTDLGAPAERVRAHGGGWVIDHLDPQRAYDQILAIADDGTEYRRVLAQTGTHNIRTRDAMADDYDQLYRSTLSSRRRVRPAGTAKPSSVARTAVFAPGGRTGPHPASTHVRMLRRLQHPSVRDELFADFVEPGAFLRTAEPFDIVIVQRTAIDPELVGPLLDEIAHRGVPLVVDLDDDILSIDPDHESFTEYVPHLQSLEELLRAADLVTVSTEQLRTVIEPRAKRTVVVQNMLDEFLWFGGRSNTGRATQPSNRRRTYNLLYVGTRTHSGDLALLRPVLDELRDRHGLDVRLSVIGGEADVPGGSGWYERVRKPPSISQYPTFVPWLRSLPNRWDAAVAPLQDNALNCSKSDLKFLEYSALGLAGVYAALPPYEGTVVDGQNGLLADQDPESWVAAILRLLSDDGARDQMAERAKGYVIDQRCLSLDAADYARLLTGLIG